jgi:alpha-tubulin suppressor-like RCC1 family protein
MQVGFFDNLRVKQVGCGANFTVALCANEKVYSFGSGAYGVLGLGHGPSSAEPKLIEALRNENVLSIAVGWSHSLALSTEGRVFEWGSPYKDICAKVPTIPTPTLVSELEGVFVAEIAAGNYHSLALERQGRSTVWSWGGNGFG